PPTQNPRPTLLSAGARTPVGPLLDGHKRSDRFYGSTPFACPPPVAAHHTNELQPGTLPSHGERPQAEACPRRQSSLSSVSIPRFCHPREAINTRLRPPPSSRGRATKQNSPATFPGRTAPFPVKISYALVGRWHSR